MHLHTRNRLPWLVGLLWLFLTWYVLLGAPSFREAFALLFSRELASRYSTFEVFTWFAAMFFTMIVVDNLYCRWVRWRIGVDSMTIHWSKLRTRDGRFICAACHGVFLLPPEDLSDEGWAYCGDCGHLVAPYGEMKPHFITHAKWSGPKQQD